MQRKHFSFRWFALGIMFGSLCTSGMAATDYSPEKVFAALRASDEKILRNVTLSARVNRSFTGLDGKKLGDRTGLVYVAESDGTWVAHTAKLPDQPPPTRDEITISLLDASPNRDGEILKLRGEEGFTWSSDTESASRGGYQKYFINSKDQVRTGEFFWGQLERKAALGGPCWSQMSFPLLGLGRGYSFFIDNIEHLEKLKNGLIRCSAKGQYPNAEKLDAAAWELEIDPKASFLVRNAECRLLTKNMLILGIRNGGLSKTRHGTMAKSGSVTFAPKGEYPDEKAAIVEFLDLQSGVDEKLFDKAKQLCCEPLDPGAQVFDRRSGIPKAYIAGGDDDPARK